MMDAIASIRERIEHVDNLISQRLNFLLTSQAFLLSALAVCYKNTQLPDYIPHERTLVRLIPWLGLFCVLFVGLPSLQVSWLLNNGTNMLINTPHRTPHCLFMLQSTFVG